MYELLESTSNLLIGMSCDPRIPGPVREILKERGWHISAKLEEHDPDEAAYFLEMIRWAYSKLHHVEFSNQDDALMLDRMKLLLEHNVV